MKMNNLDSNYERLNNFLRQISKGYFNEYDAYHTNKAKPDYNPDHTDIDTENDHTEQEEGNDHSVPENKSGKLKKKRKK